MNPRRCRIRVSFATRSPPKVARGRGAIPGVFMSGHWRFCFAACFLLASLSTAAAASNPLAALFGQTAPAEAATQGQAPAKEECLLRPGRSTDPGHHWFYYSDGHHKCWFEGAEGTAASRRPIRHRVIEHAAAAERNKGTPRDRKVFADARDELPRTAAETSEPPARVPEVKLVDAASVPDTGAATPVPATPLVGNTASDQVMPERPTLPQLNEEALLAAAPATSSTLDTPANSAAPITVSTPEASEVGGWSLASWLGVLLIALGGIALLGSSRTIRRPHKSDGFADRLWRSATDTT